MRSFLTLLIPGLFALLLVFSAHAQEAPAPEVLLRNWHTSQMEQLRTVDAIALREEASWTVDGPFGLRTTRFTATIDGKPSDPKWRRNPRSLELDGGLMGPGRWREVERRHGALFRNQIEPTVHLFLLAPSIERLRPLHPPVQEAVDGVVAWRFEVAPPGPRGKVERLTFWLDARTGHLLRSRLMASPPHRSGPIQIVTDYHRQDGLDVPLARRMEGMTQMKRRMRSFTVLFTYEAHYTEYRFAEKP